MPWLSRTSKYFIYMFLSHGHAMAQAVSHQPLTMEARAGPYGICGGQIYCNFTKLSTCQV
jgi:hypothetical protein